MFFLDDEDPKLVDLRRGDHMKAGFALQMVTVRWLGTFLEDPLDVPGEVLDFVAGQLGIANPAVVKRYTERAKTKSDHQQAIRWKYGLRDLADAEAELTEWVAARAWTSGDGPKAIFLDAMTWLRERKVLLPGVTTLVRLVARVRDEVTHRLWRMLEALLTPAQRRVLDRLLEVPPGMRVSDLERWRKGPPPRGSGPVGEHRQRSQGESPGLGWGGGPGCPVADRAGKASTLGQPRAGSAVPRCAYRAQFHVSARTAGRGDPVRPDYGPAGQRGNPGAVRPVPHRR